MRRHSAAFLMAASVACIALSTASFSSTAQKKTPAPNAAKVQAGQQLFLGNCMACHALIEGQTSLGPNLYHVETRAKDRKTPAQIESNIINGKGKMPSFKGRLSDADIANILAYVKTI